MRTRLLFCLLSLCTASFAQAQFRCGFEAQIEKISQQDPAYKQGLRQMDDNLRSVILRQSSQRVTGIQAALYTIPVVVHVIHTGGAVGSSYNPSAAQIQGALDYLNAVYDGTWTGSGGSIMGVGDIQIRFVLATRDPNGAASTGINRIDASTNSTYVASGVNLTASSGISDATLKNFNRWDPYKYYNIWLVNKIDGCDGITGCSSFYAGYATFPIGYNFSAASRDTDGTVMLASQMVAGQKTLPHEIGHAFNLYHPFQGETVAAGANTCPPNTTTGGDQCADTNPITNPADDGEASPFSCRTGTGCYGYAYNDNTERNFMNYTACYRLFTADQKARMLASAQSTMRASLATSWANNEMAYPVSWVAPVAPTVTPVSTNTSSNVAGITYVTLNNRTVHSLNATQDGGYVNGANKWYNLFHLQNNTAYSLSVKLYGVNAEQLGVWIDYNGDGDFADANEQLYLQTNISTATAASPITINFTTPVSVSGNIVRMRILEDLSTIYGVPAITHTTSSLVYGQAEDYPTWVQNSALPLRLITFTGKKEGTTTSLAWKTTEEINTKEFSIERSHNGSSYTSVGIVPAKGGAGDNSYTFRDGLSQPGSYLYRLKMIDQDNSFTYSNILPISLDNSSEVRVVGNPFRESVKLLLPRSTGVITFRVMDAIGQTLFTEKRTGSPAAVELNFGKSWSAGVYFLETTINGEKVVTRLVRRS